MLFVGHAGKFSTHDNDYDASSNKSVEYAIFSTLVSCSEYQTGRKKELQSNCVYFS